MGYLPLPDTCPIQNTFLAVGLKMNARIATQYGATHCLEICKVSYRILAASPPMRRSRLGSPENRATYVIPAKAGIQSEPTMDPRFRGDDNANFHSLE